MVTRGGDDVILWLMMQVRNVDRKCAVLERVSRGGGDTQAGGLTTGEGVLERKFGTNLRSAVSSGVITAFADSHRSYQI